MAKIRVLYMATKKPRYNDFKIEKINLCLYFSDNGECHDNDKQYY